MALSTSDHIPTSLPTGGRAYFMLLRSTQLNSGCEIVHNFHPANGSKVLNRKIV